MKVSIVILNFNTKDLLNNCLNSVFSVIPNSGYEVIVVDNGSSDGSVEMIKQEFKKVILVKSPINLGYAAGNNLAKKVARGEYILFLNSDTLLSKNTVETLVDFLGENENVGAITCRVNLPNGKLDRDTRRSFPTPWVALTHFSGLDKIWPKSPIFARYWYGYKKATEQHDVEVIQGAFFLIRRSLLDEIGWFDEDYFLDGEDIDLCWKVREAGMRIVYYPKVSITHFKGATKGKIKKMRSNSKKDRMRYVTSGVDSMRIFYKKRMWSRYNIVINYLVLLGIYFIKVLRYIKVSLL